MRTDRRRSERFLAALLHACVLWPLAAGAIGYPAQDTGYGGQPDGIVRVAFDRFGNDTDAASAAIAMPGAGLLVAGTVETGASSSSDIGFAALDGSGLPDATFGATHDGRALAGMAPTASLQQVVATVDGGYLFLGRISDAAAVIGKLDATGAVDPAFNGTGRRNIGAGVFLDGGTALYAQGLVALPDGRFLVAGYAGNATTVCAAIARFNADGSTDTTFATGRGAACEAPQQQATRAAGAFALALAPDGGIALAGTAMHPGGSGFDMAVAKFSADGVLDTTFGPGHDGWAYAAFDRGDSLDDYAYALAFDQSGRILLAGQIDGPTDEDIGIARLLANGSIDTTFASGGLFALDLGLGGWNYDFAHSVFVLPDRHILVGGYSQKNSTVGTAIELRPDGTPEPAFGNGGVFLQADPDGAESTILTSQRLLVSGDWMYMIGSIVNPVPLPGGQRNDDFGVVRYSLPLFRDGFDSGELIDDVHARD